MKYLDDIYKRSGIAWFTPVELFKVLSLSLCDGIKKFNPV
jgi:hypothetical protein